MSEAKNWEPIEPNYPYTVKEIAWLLRMNPITLRQHIKAGTIKAAKIGREYRILGKDVLALFKKEGQDESGVQ